MSGSSDVEEFRQILKNDDMEELKRFLPDGLEGIHLVDVDAMFHKYHAYECKKWWDEHTHVLDAYKNLEFGDRKTFLELLELNTYTAEEYANFLFIAWNLKRCDETDNIIKAIHESCKFPLKIPIDYEEDRMQYEVSRTLELRKRQCRKAVAMFMFNTDIERDVKGIISKMLLKTQTEECWSFTVPQSKQGEGPLIWFIILVALIFVVFKLK